MLRKSFWFLEEGWFAGGIRLPRCGSSQRFLGG